MVFFDVQVRPQFGKPDDLRFSIGAELASQMKKR
jgi:hypothetical protein